ncbi:TTAGGG repeat binding factor [Maudiozyma exigua]|uniref:TTAGGG repeat binding factor n=1 Tax=Maudiozyma exigua TaxID=34358 RepID=A0A9P6WBQ0_MAUEX|nr:TTAGGG repeat binding factor [Kazachstania exigua]
MSSDSNSISAAIAAAQAESVNVTKNNTKKNNNASNAATDIADTISKEADTENLNRFNGIIDKLPIRTKLTISSLCLLDNISTQLLRFLIFNSNSPQVIALYVEHDTYLSSGETEIFQTLLQLFKQVRLIYNTRSPLLQVHDVAPGLWFPNTPAPAILMGHEAYIITAIRKANLLTFILTTLGCFNYGFELLQQSFMDIFCPNTIYTGNSNTEQIGKFLKSQAILFLDLKTQAYISGLRDIKGESDELNTTDKMELLKEIFPDNLADRLIQRRTGSATATKEEGNIIPSEQDFIERCDRRKENLSNFTSYAELVESYDWNHFVKEILDYCNRNMGLIIWGRKGRGRSPLYAFDKEEFDNQILYSSGAVAPDAKNASASFAGFSDLDGHGNFTVGMNIHSGLEDDDDENRNNDYSQTMASFGGVGGSSMSQVSKDVTSSLVGAAIAASAKSGIKKLKPKRTWSPREDQALRKGLQEVGPSW